MWSVVLSPAVGEQNLDYAATTLIEWVLKSRSSIDATSRVVGGPTQVNPAVIETGLQVPNIFFYAGMNDVLHDILRSLLPRSKSYRNLPDLVGREFGIRSSDGEIAYERMDIIEYAPRIASSAKFSGDFGNRAAALARLDDGIAATRLESLLLGEPSGNLSRKEQPWSRQSSIELLQLARDRGIEFTVLTPDNAGKNSLMALDIPASAKAELLQSLEAGNVFVMPMKSTDAGGISQIAWWRLDPRSGQFTGTMPGGRGDALVEYSMLERSVMGVYFWILTALPTKLGCWVAFGAKTFAGTELSSNEKVFCNVMSRTIGRGLPLYVGIPLVTPLVVLGVIWGVLLPENTAQ